MKNLRALNFFKTKTTRGVKNAAFGTNFVKTRIEGELRASFSLRIRL